MPFSGYCASSFLVVKVGAGVHRGWFPTGTRVDAESICASVTDFWVLVLTAYNGAIDGDGVANAANTGVLW